MKICIFGDSHVAALKQGWTKVAQDYPGVELDFFGARKSLLADVEIREGRVVPTADEVRRSFEMTSGGRAEAHLADYTVIVVAALKFSHVALLRTVYSRYRSDEHTNLDGDVELLSAAALKELARKRLASSLGYKLAVKLQAAAEGRVIIMPQPRPSVGLLDTKDKDFDAPLWQAAVAHGDDAPLDKLFLDITADMTKSGSEFLHQPESTRSGFLFTREEYSTGSVRLSGDLDVEHGRMDFGHMNGAYGAVMVRSLISLVNGQ